MAQQHLGTVYLAGPIAGKTYEQARFGWRKYVADRLQPGIRALSPLRHEGHLDTVEGPLGSEWRGHFLSYGRAVVEKDVLDIRRSDVVLVNFLEANGALSRGTLVELGMAYAMQKTIVTATCMGDYLYEHPFIVHTSSLVVHTLDDAIHAVNSLLSTGV